MYKINNFNAEDAEFTEDTERFGCLVLCLVQTPVKIGLFNLNQIFNSGSSL